MLGLAKIRGIVKQVEEEVRKFGSVDELDYITQALEELSTGEEYLKNKLRQKNRQIKQLKDKLNWCRERLLQEGIRTDFGN